MTLVATLSAPGATGISLVADEITLDRRVGSAVRLSLLVDVPRDDDTSAQMADLLQACPATVEVSWEGSSVNVLDRKIVPVCTIVAARWTETAHKLLIEALHTQLRPPAEDLLTPKWRVHRKDSLGDLLRAFPDVVMLSDGVAYELDQIKFPLGARNCIVQAGISDWELVNEALRRYRIHKRDAQAKHIVLTGGVDEQRGTSGKWIATFADKAAYEEQNDIDGRSIQAPADVSDETWSFGALRAPDLCPGAPLGRTTEVIRSYLNPTMREWKTWRSRDLPLFTSPERRMVWRVSDRLTRTGDNLEWWTALHILPDGAAVPAPYRPHHVASWTGTGVVKEASGAGPWMTVQLPEPFASGENEIDARLTTMYSGAQGKTGLHLVPEKDTQVLLHWPGGLGDAVLALGNVRSEAAEIEAPSLSLLKRLELSLHEVTFDTVGAITAKSDVAVSAQKKTSLKSTGAIQIVGEQAMAEFSGSTFNVGQAG